MLEIKESYVPLVVGSLVGKTEKDRLKVCPFFRSVGFRHGLPYGVCSVGSFCVYHGKHVRLKAHFGFYEVVFLCPCLIGYPNEGV